MRTNAAPTNPAARTAASHPAPDEAEVQTVDRQTLQACMKHPDQLTVIDARSSGEFGTVHIHHSSNVPLPLLGENAAQLADRIGHRVVLVCQSGPRATDAPRRLATVGMIDLHVLEGVSGFDRASSPVVRDRPRWAVELQVRLTAGSLVAAGAMGSLCKRPAIALAGAIGVGLIDSGVTDSCAMARVPVRAANNRVGKPVEPAGTLEAFPPRREVRSR